MTRTRALAALIAAALLLGGCLNPKNPGEVVSREDDTRYERHRVCVRYDGGGTECGGVSEEVHRSCPVGYRWPDCRNNPIP